MRFAPALVLSVLALGSPALAQQARAELGKALRRARKSGALDRLTGERTFAMITTRTIGGGASASQRALRTYRGVLLDALEPPRLRLEVEKRGRWGGLAQVIRYEVSLSNGDVLVWAAGPSWGELHEFPLAPDRWEPSWLPSQVAELVLPVLWDQGLGAKLTFRAVSPGGQAREWDTTYLVHPEGARIVDQAWDRRFLITKGQLTRAEYARTLQRPSADGRGVRDVRELHVLEAVTRERAVELLGLWERQAAETQLTLRVVDEAGEPVAGVGVFLVAPGASVASQGRTDAKGRARFPRGKPGAYRLKCRKAGFMSFKVSGSMELCEGERTAPLLLDVRALQKGSVTVELRRSPR